MIVDEAQEKASRMAAPFITVLIPTYNRAKLLQRTLRCLEGQTFRDFEVIVIDDGSTDDTVACVEAFMQRTVLPIRFRTQPNGGPARARNVGLSLVRTPVVVMIGDDTWPEPGFVAAHAAFHRDRPELIHAAVGHTRWCEELQVVTPFMRWLDMHGIQFAYKSLLAGDAPDWRHFYTSNLSAKAGLVGHTLFNEDFPAAAMEDMEAGYRLQVGQGMTMAFLPDAVTRHVHPMNLASSCRRGLGVGESMALFQTLWPEHRDRPLGNVKRMAIAILTHIPLMRIVIPPVGWWTDRYGVSRLAMAVIRAHELIGIRKGMRRWPHQHPEPVE